MSGVLQKWMIFKKEFTGYAEDECKRIGMRKGRRKDSEWGNEENWMFTRKKKRREPRRSLTEQGRCHQGVIRKN